MSEEEKEINKILDCDDCKFAACELCEINYNQKKLISKYIIKLTDEIERQQKEIEELKEVQQKICNEELIEESYVKENYIAKSKIEEKIEKLEKKQEKLDDRYFIYSEYEMYRKVIFILEELLEKEG